VKGPGAETWLNAVFANRMPSVVGKSCLTPLIGMRGGIAGDFTVTRLSEGEYRVFGSGMAERYHKRFFDMVPLPEGTSFQSLTDALCGFNVAGPKARDTLQRLTNADLSSPAFPFMASRRVTVAGVDVVALRVSFTGDLGWELYCEQADQVALYAALLEAARIEGGGPVGSRALMSLRVEKGYGSWGREYSPEYWPQEVGFDRLIKMDKGPFLNRDAYAAIAGNPARDRLIMISVEAEGADANGGEPIFLPDGTPVGQVTSGTYGHSVGLSLAMGYVKAGLAKPGDEVSVAILGRPHKAVLLAAPPFDPAGQRLRM
jgi:dimethylglycine dehydrogenase